MPPKLQEKTVKGFCAKVKTPPKGVGGSIVQSVELKRNVSQSRRGNKVYERAIEEKQTVPGLTTTRVGTKIYYFDNDDSGFNAKMETLNKELNCKCDEMDELDASLAQNELRMAELDAELEKLNIKGDEAIEDAIITESEDLDLLLVPSIQNLIFKIYSESGITIPSDSDKSKKSPKTGRSKGDLKEICKQFCKDEFEKLERDKARQNVQQKSCEPQPNRAPQPAGGSSPCIDLSTASELEDCYESCAEKFPQPPVQNPSAPPCSESSSSVTDCDEPQENPQAGSRGQQPQAQSVSSSPCSVSTSSESSAGQDNNLANCINDCERQFGNPQQSQSRPCPSPSPNRQQAHSPASPGGPQSPVCPPQSPRPAAQHNPVQACPQPQQNKTPQRPQGGQPAVGSPQCQNKRRPPATLEDCMKDCDTNFGKNRAQSPGQAAPQSRPVAQQGRLPASNSPQPACNKPQTPNKRASSPLQQCMDDCGQKFGNASAQNRAGSPSKAGQQNNPPPACPRNRAQNRISGSSPLQLCLDECDKQFSNSSGSPSPVCQQKKTPPPAAPRKAPQPQQSPPPPPPQKKPPTLEDCIRECKEKFAKANADKPRITPRPPLFSRMVNGKRCFPDISEIPKNDQTLYMAERDAYVLFRRQYSDRGNDSTFFERPNEFEEFFYSYINGTCKITVPICPPTKKSESDELVQTFVEMKKIELDTVLQRNVLDLAMDLPDRDPEVIALLMNERIPLWIDPLVMSELVTPYPLHKRLFATDVRHTAPGSMVPRTIPVQALNLMNTHVMEGVEAIIKSNEYIYPTDNIATEEIKEVTVVKPEVEENEEDEEPPDNYKCVIELHPFRVETFFQLRGANVPLWYPGMFTAFPDGRSSIKLINTPSALINTAWRMCAP